MNSQKNLEMEISEQSSSKEETLKDVTTQKNNDADPS